MESPATKLPRVFISYSHDSNEHADRVLAFANQLRGGGIDAILDQFEEFGLIEGWTRWMTKHIRDADFVLMICTEPYYRRVMGDEEPGTGQGVRWEGNLIFQYINDADTKNRRFIPVLFDNGQKAHIPDPIRPFQYYHLKGPADYDRLYWLLTNQRSTSPAPLGPIKKLPPKERRQDFFSGTQAAPEPPHNIPREGPVKFVGREQTLKEIAQKLKGGGPTAITSVAGMGGVGKTELAIRYARRHLADYPGGVCWLRARETEIAGQILNFFLTHFKLQPPDTLKDGADRVEYCWTHWPQEGQVLLILDDATHWDYVDPYLPKSDRFHVLVTTRQTFTGIQPIDLDVLPPGDALDLLKSLAGEARCEAQKADAENLCARLGYLPLALELVGRYLETRPDLTLAEMLQRLEAKGLAHSSTNRPQGHMTAKLGVAAAFELSWEALDEPARELGCLLSLYALAPIPWESVQACFPDWDEEKLETARDSGLIAAHLLQRKGDDRYQFHQLVREFFQEKLNTWRQTKQLKQSFVKNLVDIAKQVPQTPTLDIIKKVLPLVPHLEELAARINTELDDESLLGPFASLQRLFSVQSLFPMRKNGSRQEGRLVSSVSARSIQMWLPA